MIAGTGAAMNPLLAIAAHRLQTLYPPIHDDHHHDLLRVLFEVQFPKVMR